MRRAVSCRAGPAGTGLAGRSPGQPLGSPAWGLLRTAGLPSRLAPRSGGLPRPWGGGLPGGHILGDPPASRRGRREGPPVPGGRVGGGPDGQGSVWCRPQGGRWAVGEAVLTKAPALLGGGRAEGRWARLAVSVSLWIWCVCLSLAHGHRMGVGVSPDKAAPARGSTCGGGSAGSCRVDCPLGRRGSGPFRGQRGAQGD